MKPLLWVVAVCVAFFSFYPVVYAIDPFIGREHIQEYDVSADIRDDGTVRVVERIMYDFALLSRHGVYRDIPRIKTNEEGVRYQMTVSDISLS